MGTKYPTQSASGYNSSPPADNGSVTESNKVKWSTIKTKLSDPVKTLAEAIDTAMVEYVDLGPISKTANYTTTAADHMKTIECTGTFTVTLLAVASAGAGYTVTIKNAGSGTITVDGNASETIDGSTTLSIGASTACTLQVDTSSGAWLILSISDTDFSGLAKTDGNFIVGDGTNFVAESGATARASIGLDGTGAVITGGDIDLSDTGLKGLNCTGNLYFDTAFSTASTSWTDVGEFYIYVPSGITYIAMVIKVKSSTTAGGYTRVNSPTGTGSTRGTTSTTYEWTTETTTDISSDSGWTLMTIQLQAASPATMYTQQISYYMY